MILRMAKQCLPSLLQNFLIAKSLETINHFGKNEKKSIEYNIFTHFKFSIIIQFNLLNYNFR